MLTLTIEEIAQIRLSLEDRKAKLENLRRILERSDTNDKDGGEGLQLQIKNLEFARQKIDTYTMYAILN